MATSTKPRKPDTRPDHWFSTKSHSLWHIKAADGDHAVCSKAVEPRRGPRNETREWGIWYQTDEYLARWDHVTRCPRCTGDA